jgi:oligosaccharide repeat unit polymerase
MVSLIIFICGVSLLIAARMMVGNWYMTLLQPWIITTLPFTFGGAIASLSLSSLTAPWDGRMITAFMLGAVGMLFGSFTLRFTRIRPRAARAPRWHHGIVHTMLWGLTAVAVTANLLEFTLTGTVPVLSSEPSAARSLAAQYGYIHIFSVIPALSIPFAFLYRMTAALDRRRRLSLMLFFVVNLVLLALWMSRGLLFLPATMSAILYVILRHGRINAGGLAVLVIALLGIVVGLKSARGYVEYGDGYIARQASATDLSAPAGLAVGYLTVAMNYEILNRYLHRVPAQKDHSRGQIASTMFSSALPGQQYSELTYQNELFGYNRDRTLTSTFVGPLYLDFGWAGVLIGAVLIGLLYRFLWVATYSSRSVFFVFTYAYFATRGVFLLYGNPILRPTTIWFLVLAAAFALLGTAGVRDGRMQLRVLRVV